MQANNLQFKNSKKKRKTIGRGGKKGTYSGKGNKGQKARSGAHVDPLFEGGRSTLIDHLKKKKGFQSRQPKKMILKLSQVESKFSAGEEINLAALVKAGLIKKQNLKRGVKILGGEKATKKLTFSKDISLSRKIAQQME